MRRWAVVAGAAAVMAAAPLAFPEAPPPAHTGGFGEPTCAACHFDVQRADPAGGTGLRGLPEGGYTPGTRYLLEIHLRREGLRSAGFQLSARDSAGRQSGALRTLSDAVGVTEHRGVLYAHQTAHGAAATDSARWTVEWTAPAAGAGPVHLHLAGNAADGDASSLGDHIYRQSAVVSPR